LNNTNYRKLSRLWHPDKLSMEGNQDPFVAWYIKINNNEKDSLFKVLCQVKEVYRPELRFGINKTIDDTVYFFGAFAKYLPLVYNVFWPLFYLLEALERNIDNYPLAYRSLARIFYFASTVAPVIILFIIV